MDTTIFLTALAIGFLLFCLIRRLFERKVGRTIPGPKGFPFIGPVLTADISKLHLSCYKWAQEYGPIFQLTLFGQKIIVLNDANVIRKAYAGDTYGDYFSDRPSTFLGEYVVYEGADIFFLTRYDTKAMAMRKMLHKSIRRYGDGNANFEENVQCEIRRLLQDLNDTEGNDFELKPVIRYSFGNWMSIWLSGKTNSAIDSEMIWKFNDSAMILLETSLSIFLTTFPFLRFFPFWPGKLCGQAIKARDMIMAKFMSFENRHEENEEGMVNVLLEYQREQNEKVGYELITDNNVRGIILDVIAAGLPTMTTAVNACVLTLLNNPQYIKLIQNEIDEVVGRQRLPTIRDKKDMHYTSAVIYEILRYITHGVLGIPHLVNEDKEFMGYHFSKGALIFTNNWFIHRDANIWPDPWEFRPSRFLDEGGKLVDFNHLHRQTLMSFSTGRRQCVGNDLALSRIFMYISSILQTYDILPPVDVPLLDADPRKYKLGVVLEPQEFSCRMVHRE